MEDQCSPFSLGFCYQDEGMDELKHTLLYTTLELETTLISAREEITRKEFELIHLKDVLNRTLKERDEAEAKCQKLKLEKLILQQQIQQKDHHHQQQQQQESVSLSGISSSEDESKPVENSVQSQTLGNRTLQAESQEALNLAAKMPLPEKGKLLQAVKDAGPLLQNLLLAGPLPQWQHPPPQLTSIDIPPVAISSPTQPATHHDSFKKRGRSENYDSSDSSPSNTKYQKIVLQ